MKTHSRLLSILLAVALLLSLTMTAALAEPRKITFWHCFGGTIGEALQATVDAFNASQTDVFVEATFQGSYDETLTKLKAALPSGTGPDVFQMFELGTTYLTYAGYTIPFQDLLEADADPYISIDDIEPVLRNYYTYNGKMQCIPLNPSTPIMYYNKTIFKAAGLDPEAPPTTFAEIAAIADKLMATGGNLQAAMGLPIYGWFFENFLAGLEKCYVNNNNGRTGIATAIEYDTNGAGVKILETWKSMVDAGIIYNFGQVNADSRAAFIAGQTAITLESTAQLTTLTNSIAGAFELGTAYLPSMLDKSNGGVLIGGANLWVVKNEDSQRVADTWSFVKFATSAPVSAAFSMRTGYFCANTTAYNEPSFQEFLKERPNFLTAINQLHDTPVNYATQGAAVGVMAELRAIWQENMDLYLQGALTTEEALSNMAAASNEAITYYNTTVYGK